MLTRVTTALQVMAKDQEVTTEMEAEGTARRIIAVMDGLQIQWLLTERRFDMAESLTVHLRGLGLP